MSAIIVKTSGEHQILDHVPSLTELQNAVGGWIEAVRLTLTVIMWVNEEGLLKNLPVNPMASKLADALIVGDVIFTGAEDDAGNLLPLRDASRVVLLGMIGDRDDQG